jgi:hypothetical protein
MGSIISKISEDIDQYVWLCEYYDEKPEYSHGSESCYGEHAKKLKARFQREVDAREGKTPNK